MKDGSFAHREAGIAVNVTQPGTINDRVRNCIWNLVHEKLILPRGRKRDDLRAICIAVREYRHTPTDDVAWFEHECISELKGLFTDPDWPWYQPYDLLEFVTFEYLYSPPDPRWASSQSARQREGQRIELARTFNAELARAGSAYRFVAYRLTPITSEVEAHALTEAMALPDKFRGAREHIRAGLESLSKMPEPEIRNCIEESLHAVESALKISTGISTGGVKDAMDQFASRHGIHSALRDAICKLYGYASDKPGLRHPLLAEASDLTAVDARMMIVTASALVNWIVAKDSGLTS